MMNRQLSVHASMLLLIGFSGHVVRACCTAMPPGRTVVNADQTVILLWDATTKTEHFIRKASFAGDSKDFGFLIPSPTQPQLSESGNEAFDTLADITKPEIVKKERPTQGTSCGCGQTAEQAASMSKGATPLVHVLDSKLVAGFNAVVLETRSASSLVSWLKAYGYAYSLSIAAWAKPYVEKGWKITALKVATDKNDPNRSRVNASALRLSFKTDQLLFPYREGEYKQANLKVGASSRLLRIYVLAEARYTGKLGDQKWTSDIAWAGKVSSGRREEIVKKLGLPSSNAPAEIWLTEFEHNWPYTLTKSDVTFEPDADQSSRKRPPVIEYVSNPVHGDAATAALAIGLIGPIYLRRRLRRK